MLFNWFCPDRFEQYFYEGYLAGIGRKLQLFKLLINPFGCKQSALIKRVRDFVIHTYNEVFFILRDSETERRMVKIPHYESLKRPFYEKTSNFCHIRLIFHTSMSSTLFQ